MRRSSAFLTLALAAVAMACDESAPTEVRGIVFDEVAGNDSGYTNQNPPPQIPYASSVFLNDQALGGFIHAKVGNNLVLGEGGAVGSVGLRHDPDGAGPYVNAEVVNEGFFEERFCLRMNTDLDGSPGRVHCNASFSTNMVGAGVTEVTAPGVLQAVGSVMFQPSDLVPDLNQWVRVDQVVTLRHMSNALYFEVSLTNEGPNAVHNVEYLRNFDADHGVAMVDGHFSGNTTDNQTINRPQPGAPLPMIVAASKSVGPDFDPTRVETRTVGLGTPVAPPAGGVADVAILNFNLVETNANQTIDGSPFTNRGPWEADVGTTIAWRIPTLDPGASLTLEFCYAISHNPAVVDLATSATDIVNTFNTDCQLIITGGAIEVVIGPGGGEVPVEDDEGNSGGVVTVPPNVVTGPVLFATEVVADGECLVTALWAEGDCYSVTVPPGTELVPGTFFTVGLCLVDANLKLTHAIYRTNETGTVVLERVPVDMAALGCVGAGGLTSSFGHFRWAPTTKVLKAHVKFGKKSGDDKFDVRGFLHGTNHAITTMPDVTITFGECTAAPGADESCAGAVGQVIPGSAFQLKGKNHDKWVFKAPKGSSGISKVEIWDDGRFKVSAKHVDLTGIVNLADPSERYASFVIEIGDQLEGVGLTFDAKGKYKFGGELAAGVQDLLDDIDDLTGLTDDQFNGIQTELEKAKAELVKGHINHAADHLGHFVKKVQGLIDSGALTAAVGQPLVDDASFLIGIINTT